MASRTRSIAAEEIDRIEDLIGDLEKRLKRLNRNSSIKSSNNISGEVSGAGNDVNAFVTGAIASVLGRVRATTNEMTEAAAGKAAKASNAAIDHIVREIEARPLALLAVAAGLGYLFGLSRR